MLLVRRLRIISLKIVFFVARYYPYGGYALPAGGSDRACGKNPKKLMPVRLLPVGGKRPPGGGLGRASGKNPKKLMPVRLVPEELFV